MHIIPHCDIQANGGYMKRRKIVVIGGSAAGAKAAAKARRHDMAAEITVVQKSADLSMATCGYPYYVGGTFDNRDMLVAAPNGVVRDPHFFNKVKDIRALIKTEVVDIDRAGKKVHCRESGGDSTFTLEYDKLILATGASPVIPEIPGIELGGVTTLLTLQDCDVLRNFRDTRKDGHCVIIGGGLIGLEASEALKTSGIDTTLIEMGSQLLPFLDEQLAMLVENHVRGKGVHVKTNTQVVELLGEAGVLSGVKLDNGTLMYCDTVVLATGVKPNSGLGADAGLEIGSLGGIITDESMRTSDPDIFAAGDCVEVKHILTGQNVHAPMGDLANLQGRVAGENAVGGSATFAGTVGTGMCKVFDFAAGSTGLTEREAETFFPGETISVINSSPDKPGFMGPGLLISKIVIKRDSQQILGYQSVGTGDVSRQLATGCMAVQGKMNLTQLTCADMPYAPPFSTAIDHFVASAHIVENKLKGRLKTISAEEVYTRGESGDNPVLIDTRGMDEYEQMRLGRGEILLPLGALREKTDLLPQDKQTEIVCFCKISLRGYEAALILENLGYTRVRVMEGGIMAWPYRREK